MQHILYSPHSGRKLDPHVDVILVSEYRKPEVAPWRYNPWTGLPRAQLDVELDPCGLGIVPPGALEAATQGMPIKDLKVSGGGKLSGDHYYRVQVAEPMAPDVQPYTAECADIIEALGMTFNEGEAFKAIWRLAAGRQGRTKNKPQYDADKVAHYGARVAVQEKRRG